MNNSMFLLVVIVVTMGCSTKDNNKISLKLTLDYSFLPQEEFVFYLRGDTNYFEYKKKYSELDSQYRVVLDNKIYKKTVTKTSMDNLFVIKIFRTDSIQSSVTSFDKDTITGEVVVNEVDKTPWILVDSTVVRDIIYSLKEPIAKKSFQEAIDLAERVKSKEQKTSPCLDGMTVSLEYNKNGVIYFYEHNCDYTDNRILTDLIGLCESLKSNVTNKHQ